MKAQIICNEIHRHLNLKGWDGCDPITIAGDNYEYKFTYEQAPQMLKKFEAMARAEAKGLTPQVTRPKNVNERSRNFQQLYVELNHLSTTALRGQLKKAKGDDEYIISLILSTRGNKVDTAPKVVMPTVEVVIYSEKAIAIFGETKPIKEALKTMGAKFNPFLQRNGVKTPGWVASKKQQAIINQYISINNL